MEKTQAETQRIMAITPGEVDKTHAEAAHQASLGLNEQQYFHQTMKQNQFDNKIDELRGSLLGFDQPAPGG
jgi:hypothetical protein